MNDPGSHDPAAMDAPEGEARTVADMPLPGGDFRLLVQKLGYQALIGMGVLENPVTGTSQPDLARARTVVEDLVMLRQKTHGNLEDEEQEHLDGVIRDLEQHLQKLSESA